MRLWGEGSPSCVGRLDAQLTSTDFSAAEMIAGTTGIGFVENVARKQSDYEIIWMTIIIIMGTLGLAFDVMMRWIIARTIPWRGKG